MINTLCFGAIVSMLAVVPAEATVERITHTGGATIFGGLVSDPSPASPELAVRSAIDSLEVADRATLDSLRVDRIHRSAGGSVVRLQQTHRGLPVIGAGVSARVDADGSVRWVASRVRRVGPEFDVAPSVTPREAASFAVASAGPASRDADWIVDDGRVALVIYAPPNQRPRLAYRIDVPRDMRRLEALQIHVDAHTGAVFSRRNRLRSAAPRARVYPVSPEATPEMMEVELTTLLDGSATLDSVEFSAFTCVDHGTCEDEAHICEQEQLVLAGAAGDFLHVTPAGDTDPTDAYAELQAFYGATLAYEKVRSMGFEGLEEEPLKLLTNYRMADFNADPEDCQDDVYEGSDELLPLNNAYYDPDEGALIMGQGPDADYAYDGDMQVHEFGHAVMAALSPDFGTSFVDAQGINNTPGALDEGFADLLVIWMTDDPVFAEYIAAKEGAKSLRDFREDRKAPESLTGEIHDDSRPFTSAIWAARQRVGTDPKAVEKFDQALFTVQQGLEEFDGFAVVSSLIVDEVSSSMGEAAADEVREVLEEYGISQGDRVVDGSVPRTIDLTGTDFFPDAAAGVPSPLQLRFDVEKTTDVVELSADLRWELENVELNVLVKADEPLVWEETDADSWEADEELLAPLEVDGKRAVASLEGPFPPGTYYVSIANLDESLTLDNVQISAGPDAPKNDDANQDSAGERGDTGDGGCSIGGHGNPRLGWMALFVLAGIVARRRRSAKGEAT